ncbi:hypothetical protein FOXG_19484 [Fusarium oxysporum f. sp. lycopersici 4287]|uniref:Uncharacterized protein n=1 Tax=Fusarium oxysporum f. sp. lycopersici (strain 4287 / CBS 123668 / FGSC 9935 / NRRL 34936) TaxID=426428 RepID=A0A0J9V170_FUSO4|nr:hypothetical protein FOXG_19484 [Fusarium oxysporum f. sp. lycopersici 4287]KNB05060.1 hypothetical protein FOXG_19484 [Fusarium oxysporum f. sp. lycopersici 4287]
MATLQTFQTQFASVDGVNVAYRRFGKRNTFPLLSTIFKGQSIIGHSEGAAPDATTAMASIAAKLLTAI